MANSVIGALRVNLGLNSAQFSNGLRQASGQASAFSRRIGTVLQTAAIAAAGLATGLGVAVKSVLDTADEMTKMAQQVGTSVEELSRLKHAADLAGVSFTQLHTGMRRLAQNMKDASEGTGVGAEAFKSLRISAVDAAGRLKDPIVVMSELASAFQRMPDGARKTAIAMELMGRNGANLIPLMNAGADAMRAAMHEADLLGVTIDAKTGKAAEQFNDNLNRLGKTVQGITTRFAADLAPSLAGFSDWLVSVSPAIRGVSGLLSGIAQNVLLVGQALAFMATIGGESLQALYEGASAYIGEKMQKIFGAFHWAIEQVRQAFGRLVDWLSSVPFLGGLVDGARESMGELVDFVTASTGAIGDRVAAPFVNLADMLQKRWAEMFGGMNATASAGLADLGATFDESLGVLVDDVDDAKDEVDQLAGSIAGAFDNAFGSAIDSLLDGSFKLRDVLGSLLKDLGRAFMQAGFGSFAGGGSGLLGALGSLVSGLFGGFRAAGGRVSAGAAYMVGEHGPEMVVPDRPGMVVPNSALAALGGGGAVTVRLVASREFDARIETVAGRVAVETTRAGISATERARPREGLKRG